MAIIQFTGRYSGGSSTSGQVTINVSATANGEFLLAHWMSNNGSSTSGGVPAGWTQIGGQFAITGFEYCYWAYRFKQSGDASFTFGNAGGGNSQIAIIGYTGVNTTTPIGNYAQYTRASSSTTLFEGLSAGNVDDSVIVYGTFRSVLAGIALPSNNSTNSGWPIRWNVGFLGARAHVIGELRHGPGDQAVPNRRLVMSGSAVDVTGTIQLLPARTSGTEAQAWGAVPATAKGLTARNRGGRLMAGMTVRFADTDSFPTGQSAWLHPYGHIQREMGDTSTATFTGTNGAHVNTGFRGVTRGRRDTSTGLIGPSDVMVFGHGSVYIYQHGDSEVFYVAKVQSVDPSTGSHTTIFEGELARGGIGGNGAHMSMGGSRILTGVPAGTDLFCTTYFYIYYRGSGGTGLYQYDYNDTSSCWAVEKI